LPAPTWHSRIEAERQRWSPAPLIACDKPALSQLTAEIEDKGGEALGVTADVSDARKVFAAADESDDLALKTADRWLLYNDQAFAHFEYLKRQQDRPLLPRLTDHHRRAWS
jgi:hypothetical protein